MHQGNWKCSSCGGAITELPFVPRSESGLTCRTCYTKSKGNQSAPSANAVPESLEATDIPEEAGLADEQPPAPDLDGATPIMPKERPKFTGEWQCSICGASITSLPFEPRNTSNLKCLDCFKGSRGN